LGTKLLWQVGERHIEGMALDILQRFLTARLFDVGGDDTRVVKLREAAADLANVIKAAPHRVAIFTMVAIDGQIGPDDPLIIEVTGILEKRWQSYAGAFVDASLPTVARAIVLQALASAMASDAVAAAVTLTARNMLPHIGAQSDRNLWIDLIQEADRRLDTRAQREWALPHAAAASDVALTLDGVPALAPPTLSRDWLTKQLQAASGPSNAQGEALKTPNPHWPNEGSPWSHQFAPAAASATAAAVDAVIKALAEKVDEQAGAKALADTVSKYVSEVAATLTQTAAGIERRTSLLWWKEALFSPSTGLSYRDLAPPVAAALAALDASAQTQAFAPRMAEAFVRETVRSIGEEKMLRAQPISQLCSVVIQASDDVRTTLREGYAQVHTEAGRIPLAGVLAGELDASVLSARLGIDGSVAISPADFGVWLFRDLQAAAATPAGTKRKRQSRPQ